METRTTVRKSLAIDTLAPGLRGHINFGSISSFLADRLSLAQHAVIEERHLQLPEVDPCRRTGIVPEGC